MNATVKVAEDQVVQGDLELKIKCVQLCRDPSLSSTDTTAGCTTIYKVGHASPAVLQLSGVNTMSVCTCIHGCIENTSRVDSYFYASWYSVVLCITTCRVIAQGQAGT